MPVRSILAVVALLLLAVPGARAESAEDHLGKRQRTVQLGNERVVPTDVTLGADEVLTWQNESVHTMQVTFVSPPDIEKKVRCGLLRMPASQRPPWGVFEFRNGRLTGVVPPGRFASICEFEPGEYTYTVKHLDGEAAAGGKSSEVLDKGTVTVK